MTQGEGLLGSKKCVKTISEKNATAFEILSNGNLIFASKSILKVFDTKKYQVTEEIDTKYSNSPITKIKELKEGKPSSATETDIYKFLIARPRN